MSSQPRLNGLTGLRFFAALHVVFYHFAGTTMKGLPWPLKQLLVDSGYAAVSLFFVLSGFILAFNYGDRLERQQVSRGRFWEARFARIYPLYVFAALCEVPFQIWLQRVPLRELVPATIAHLFGLQTWIPRWFWMGNVPGWSISAEAFFYLLFPWLVVRLFSRGSNAGLLAKMGGWWLIGLSLPLLYLRFTPADPWTLLLRFSPISRLPEFIVGIGLGKLFLRDRALARSRPGGFLALIGLALLIPAGICQSQIPYALFHNGLLVPGFALLIYGIAHQGRLTSFLSWRWLVLLGDASYAVYLLQNPVYHLLEKVTGINWPGRSSLFFCGYLLVLVLTAVVAHRLIEKPAQAWLAAMPLRRRFSLLPATRTALLWSVLPYLALAALHLVSGLPMRRPVVFADELGYLGNARYIAGAGPITNLGGLAAFYHGGYSLLIAPAFWLSRDPNTCYSLVIALNGLMLSALYFPLVLLLRKGFAEPWPRAALAASVTCLYPAFVLCSNLAWSENAFIPLFACWLLAFLALARRPSAFRAALVGGLAAVLYAVHPRALPLLPLTLMHVSVLAWKHRRRVDALACALALLSVYVVAIRLNDHLDLVGWAGVGQYRGSEFVSALLSVAGVRAFYAQMLGQLWYLSIASFGMVVLGAVAIVIRVRDRSSPPGDPTRHVLTLLLLSGGALYLAACLHLAWVAVRSDPPLANFVYGRYCESFSAVVTLLGIRELLSKQSVRSGHLRLARFAALFGLLGVGAWFALHGALGKPAVQDLAVLGLDPFLRGAGRTLNLPAVTVLTFAIGALALQGARLHRALSVAILVAVFSATSGIDYVRCFLSEQRAMRHAAKLADAASATPGIRLLSYDEAFLDGRLYCLYQFLLPTTTFSRFDSRRGERPASPLVVSSAGWRDARSLGAHAIAAEPGADQVLWLVQPEYGARQVQGAAEQGFYGPETSFGHPIRWTNGAARIDIPAPLGRPGLLRIELGEVSVQGTELEVRVNGRPMFHGPLQAGPWSKTLPLGALSGSGRPITVELLSGTFVPERMNRALRDGRTLGVAVRSIQLVD